MQARRCGIRGGRFLPGKTDAQVRTNYWSAIAPMREQSAMDARQKEQAEERRAYDRKWASENHDKKKRAAVVR